MSTLLSFVYWAIGITLIGFAIALAVVFVGTAIHTVKKNRDNRGDTK